MKMKTTLACVVALTAPLVLRAQSTIDLEQYRDNSRYTMAEQRYEVGGRGYQVVNIRPAVVKDTACISALVIDKRKFVLVDLTSSGGSTGMVVPREQPIENCLLAVKLSAIDAKTFLIFANGKVVSIPGDRLLLDEAGKTLLSVWDNSGEFLLTVFDYRAMRLMLSPVPIARPESWYTNGLAWFFKADDGGLYTFDMFSKNVSPIAGVEGELQPVRYVFEPSTVDADACCGAAALAPIGPIGEK